MVTQAEVAFYGELAHRLSLAAGVLGSLGSEVGNLLVATRWKGAGASAAHAEAQRLATRLGSGSAHLRELSVTATHTMRALATELAARQAREAAVLHELGRLAALPGDLEERSRAAVRQLLSLHGLRPGDDVRHPLEHIPRSLRTLLW